MDARGDTQTTNDQLDLQNAELAALRRMLTISEGTFSFSVAICNGPSLRDYLISKLKQEFPSIAVVEVNKEITDILDLVRTSIPGSNYTGIFVVGIEKVLPSDRKEHKVLMVLNVSRESWQSQFSCPVVFWLAEYAATLLSIHARDFWSWISHIFEFVSEQATAIAGTLDAYPGDIMSAGRLDADQKRFRIAELEQRIKDAGDPPRQELSQHVLTWLNELVYIRITIGELDKAEDNILNALQIAQKLDIQEAIAVSYGNLGLIYQTRGDLDKAEQMLKKSMTIDKMIGRLEGMANSYGNLGLIHLKRGELDKAEQMHKKALDIEEKLERSEGMANSYAALALVYQHRGDLEEAEKMHRKGLEVEEKIRRPEGIARQYGNLGAICRWRGDLERAEQMYKKALEINEKLGRLESVANQYGNLGAVYRDHGDVDKAGECWEKALRLFKKIGMKQEIEKVQGWIDGLKDDNKRA